MKSTESRPFADADAAARKLVNAVEPVQDGGVHGGRRCTRAGTP